MTVGGQRRPEDSFWILLHVFSERDCGILGQIHPCSLAKACLSFSSSPPVAQGSRNFELVLLLEGSSNPTFCSPLHICVKVKHFSRKAFLIEDFYHVGGFSAVAQITPTASTRLGCISSLSTGSCVAQASGSVEAVSEWVPEDVGGDRGRCWQLLQWRMDEKVCFEQCVG